MRQTLRLVDPNATPQWCLMAGGIMVLLAEMVFRVLEPWSLRVTIDSLVATLGRHTGSVLATVSSLVGLGIALLVIVVERAVCNCPTTMAFALVGSCTTASLCSRASHRVQGLSQQFHARNHSADTVQRLIADVSRTQEVTVTAGLLMAANTLTLPVMVVAMVFLDPLLAMIALLAVMTFLLASSGNSWWILVTSLRNHKLGENLANTAREALGAIEVVQAYGLEPLPHERFTGTNSVSLSEGMRSRRIAVCLECSTDVVVDVVTAVVMVGGGIRVLNGATFPGGLALFATCLRTTMKPLRDMVEYTGYITRVMTSGKRVANLMVVKPDIVSPVDTIVLDRVHSMIHFDHVHAAYEGYPVLYGVNLTMVPDERVALVGPSGSDKSTLVSLIMQALNPTSGTVNLDGHSLNKLDLHFLRSQASVLHREAVLLTGTIRENIRPDRPDILDEEVETTARAAHAYEFITQIPGDYDTTVGERGGTPSGGQRQRIAIARALPRGSPIVILDEAITGLDPASASAMLETIDELVARRTTLTIIHDPQTVMHAGRVVWIQGGRIHLEGSPQDFMESLAGLRRWANSHLADSFALMESGP